MRRRDFITLPLLGGAVAWPLPLHAQQSATVSRIGVPVFGPASVYTGRVEALRAGLRQLGYVEGKNIVIEFRWAETVAIPIVFGIHADPVGLGHVASLA